MAIDNSKPGGQHIPMTSDQPASIAPPAGAPAGMRLQKLLAARGVASRRHAEELMLAGRVTVNGAPACTLGLRVDPERDDIRVDGRPLRATPRPRTILLNKPAGYECTAGVSDGPTVFDLLTGIPERLVTAGRLDKYSEGLIVLSNDGALVQRLTHPSHGHHKIYEVTIRGAVTPEHLRRLGEPFDFDEARTRPARVRRLAAPGPELTRLEIVLGEGRNRQIRRMCEVVGLPIKRLARVQIGGLRADDLPVGHWRDLTTAEIARMLAGPAIRA